LNSVPSMRHHGPTFEFHPIMLLMMTECAWISESSNTIELMILTPSCILQ